MNLSYQWVNETGAISQFTTSQIQVTEAGNYTAIITNEDNGCIVEVPLLVEENITEPIANILGDNQLTCEITSLNLQASDIDQDNNYQWLDAAGNIISSTSTVDINSGGFYTLVVTNILSECVQEDAIDISQSEDLPVFSFETPQILDCRNETAVIEVSSNDPGLIYNFTTTNGNISSFESSTFIVNEPGVYTISALNSLTGCERIQEVEVLQNIEAPIVDAGPGFELTCTELVYQLQGSTDLNDNFTLVWTSSDPNSFENGENTLSPTVNKAGTYELTIVNDINGCSTTDIVNVSLDENVPNGIISTVIDPLCAGDLGSLDTSGVEGGEGPYLYSIDNGENFFDNGIFEDLTPGAYEILVRDAKGCEVGIQVEIPEVLEVFASLPPELELEFGENAQLLASTNIITQDIESIVWSPSTNLSCDDCLNPQVIGVGDEFYTVTLTSTNGCVAEATIQLRVDREINVYIPNAFSPHNVDGTNDFFMIFARDGIVENINSFQIYDRWGTQVFFDENFLPNDPNHGWDGQFRGDRLNPGVFVYWTEIEFIDGTTTVFKGDLTLVD